jgi:hypothetical protein
VRLMNSAASLADSIMAAVDHAENAAFHLEASSGSNALPAAEHVRQTLYSDPDGAVLRVALTRALGGVVVRFDGRCCAPARRHPPTLREKHLAMNCGRHRTRGCERRPRRWKLNSMISRRGSTTDDTKVALVALLVGGVFRT